MKKILVIFLFLTVSINFIVGQNAYQMMRENNLKEKNRIFKSKIKECIYTEKGNWEGVLIKKYNYDKSGSLTNELCKINDTVVYKKEYRFDSLGNKLLEISYRPNDSIEDKCIFKYTSDGILIYEETIHPGNSVFISQYNSLGKPVAKSSSQFKDNYSSQEEYVYKNDSLLIEYYLKETFKPVKNESMGISTETGIQSGLTRIDTTFLSYDGIEEEINSMEYNNDNKIIKKTTRKIARKEYMKNSHHYEDGKWSMNTTFWVDTGGVSEIIRYEYDLADLLIKEVDSTKIDSKPFWAVHETRYIYNGLNEVLKKSTYNISDNSNDLSDIVESEYDGKGNKIYYSRANRDTAYYEYDVNNRLVKERNYSMFSSGNREISYQYNKNGSLIREEKYYPVDLKIYPNGVYFRDVWSDTSYLKKEITIYDDSGRITELYQYDNYGKLHGHLITSYNIFSEVTQTLNLNENGDIISKSTYEYDENGNPLSEEQINQTGVIIWSQDYKYTFYD
jgi:hypothetical protein